MRELVICSMSGGLDSSTLVAKALTEGKEVVPVNFIYGQKNIVETEAQKNVWCNLKERFPDTLQETIVLDVQSFLGRAVETFQKNRDNGVANDTTGMEFYFPSRNLLFMAVSAVVGEIIANDKSIKKIGLGLGIHKHSDIYAKDYWDISPEFADKLTELLSLNDNVECYVYAPYKSGFKSEIIKDVEKLKVPYELTWTCYDPKLHNTFEKKGKLFETYVACGKCEACLERQTQAKDSSVYDTINSYSITIPKE